MTLVENSNNRRFDDNIKIEYEPDRVVPINVKIGESAIKADSNKEKITDVFDGANQISAIYHSLLNRVEDLPENVELTKRNNQAEDPKDWDQEGFIVNIEDGEKLIVRVYHANLVDASITEIIKTDNDRNPSQSSFFSRNENGDIVQIVHQIYGKDKDKKTILDESEAAKQKFIDNVNLVLTNLNS